MITGRVSREREATIQLRVLGLGRRSQTIRAVIDTGFDGWLCLPPRLISHLRLPWEDQGHAMLADGSISTFGVYGATVVWAKRRRQITVAALDSNPLVGMALLEGYELNVEVRSGGLVTIRELPRSRNG